MCLPHLSMSGAPLSKLVQCKGKREKINEKKRDEWEEKVWLFCYVCCELQNLIIQKNCNFLFLLKNCNFYHAESMSAILGSLQCLVSLKVSPFRVVFNIFLFPFFNQLWGFHNWASSAVDSLVSLGVFKSIFNSCDHVVRTLSHLFILRQCGLVNRFWGFWLLVVVMDKEL